jgi:hypothetical protein
LPVNDNKVEIVTLDLQQLPKDVDEMAFKKNLFSTHHVIKLDT